MTQRRHLQGPRKLLKTGWAKHLKPSLRLPLAVILNSFPTWAPSQQSVTIENQQSPFYVVNMVTLAGGK